MSKDKLIGNWKEINSEFWLFETGDYKIIYNNGRTVKGSWTINGDKFNFYQDSGRRSLEYRILLFTDTKFVYQSIKEKTTFVAVKIK